MKLLNLVLLLVVLNVVTSTWLGDVFTGLNEGIEDTFGEAKKDIHKFGKKIIKNAADFLDKKVPEKMDWVQVTKTFMTSKFKQIIATADGELKVEELIEKWNKLLKDLNSMSSMQNSKEMYKTVKKEIKALLPEHLYKEWKQKVHTMAKSLKKVMEGKEFEDMKKTLKSHVKKWEQPTFMKAEDIEGEKKMIKDVVKKINEKVKLEAEKMLDKDEQRVEKWLKKRFTKPHHKSGHSKWDKLMDHISFAKLKKQFRKVSKDEIKKLEKKAKNAKVFVMKKPKTTQVKILTGKDLPLFTTPEEAKELESLSPSEKKDFEEAEAKWEKELLLETNKLLKNMQTKKSVVAPERTLKSTTPKPKHEKKHKKNLRKGKRTGNEKWNHKKILTKDDPFEDYSEDTAEYKALKTNLSKDKFVNELANEESDWFNIKEDIFKKLKKLGE